MIEKKICPICKQKVDFLASELGVCPNCVITDSGFKYAGAAHIRSRALFDLPRTPPRTTNGVKCVLCGCECSIGEGEWGFCNLRTIVDGKLIHMAGTPQKGILHWYRDPLPTNCVADWVCSGSHQSGKHNLAVFYKSCTLDCLNCQNWHFRQMNPHNSQKISASALADHANSQTHCVCYFGGDPASQMPHAIASAISFANRGIVVCWETAGTSHPKLIDRAIRLSLETGGCIKFDLKAFSEPLHIALTGWSNARTLENFARAARLHKTRPNPPLVIASTLLIPGYVNPEEVGRIAAFIAKHDPSIPYALLGFAPAYLIPDLPTTSIRHAEAARQAAINAGLVNVHIGNRHLLGYEY